MKGLLLTILFGLWISAADSGPSPAAISGFNTYVSSVESRLSWQHRSANSFLAPAGSSSQTDARLRNGELIIERLTPATGSALHGALLHHWRGTAFVYGAKAADFERLLKDFDDYPRYFAPDVLQAKSLSKHDENFLVWMRLREKHVVTVTLDSTYDVSFGRLDTTLGYSTSRSLRISEVNAPAGALNGLLWRLNTYWGYEERDGGLYIQIESVSLTRSIPSGLAWAVGPYVERIPHESLEFTLRSASVALRDRTGNPKGR